MRAEVILGFGLSLWFGFFGNQSKIEGVKIRYQNWLLFIAKLRNVANFFQFFTNFLPNCPKFDQISLNFRQILPPPWPSGGPRPPLWTAGAQNAE